MCASVTLSKLKDKADVNEVKSHQTDTILGIVSLAVCCPDTNKTQQILELNQIIYIYSHMKAKHST